MTPIREFTKIYFQGDVHLRGASEANHFILGIKPRMGVISSHAYFLWQAEIWRVMYIRN